MYLNFQKAAFVNPVSVACILCGKSSLSTAAPMHDAPRETPPPAAGISAWLWSMVSAWARPVLVCVECPLLCRTSVGLNADPHLLFGKSRLEPGFSVQVHICL